MVVSFLIREKLSTKGICDRTSSGVFGTGLDEIIVKNNPSSSNGAITFFIYVWFLLFQGSKCMALKMFF